MRTHASGRPSLRWSVLAIAAALTACQAPGGMAPAAAPSAGLSVAGTGAGTSPPPGGPPAMPPAPPPASGEAQATSAPAGGPPTPEGPPPASPSSAPAASMAPGAAAPAVPVQGDGEVAAPAGDEAPSAPPGGQDPVPGAPPSDLVLVEGGEFALAIGGARVTVSSFYVGRHEVTQREYELDMGANPASHLGPDRPVEQVSWYDAIRYCNARSRREGLPIAYNEATGDLLDADGRFAFTPNQFTASTAQAPIWVRLDGRIPRYDFALDPARVRGYRLPTNAEWEFAAMGGRASRGYAYSGLDNATDVAWLLDNAADGSRPVEQLRANELGIHDMSGNVWEWTTENGYPIPNGMRGIEQTYRSAQPVNPYSAGEKYVNVYYDYQYAGETKRVHQLNSALPYRRGGSYGNAAADVRISAWIFDPPEFKHATIGLRVVRSL